MGVLWLRAVREAQRAESLAYKAKIEAMSPAERIVAAAPPPGPKGAFGWIHRRRRDALIVTELRRRQAESGRAIYSPTNARDPGIAEDLAEETGLSVTTIKGAWQRRDRD